MPELGRNLTFVERAQRRLIRKGINNDAIVTLRTKFAGTWGEAAALGDFLESQPTHSLLIVTSPYHLRRAYWSITQNLNRQLEVYTHAMMMGFSEKPNQIYTLLKEYTKLQIYRILHRQ